MVLDILGRLILDNISAKVLFVEGLVLMDMVMLLDIFLLDSFPNITIV